MISTQRRREVDDVDDRPEFTLGSDEWPASPPRKPKSISSTLDKPLIGTRIERGPVLLPQSATTTSRTLNRASLQAGVSQTDINETSRIQGGKLVTQPSTQTTRTAQPCYSAARAHSVPPPRVHPMFAKKVNNSQGQLQPAAAVHTSSSSYSNARSGLPPLNATASRSNPSSDAAWSASTLPAAPKKRINPWEVVSPDQTKRKVVKTTSGNFGTLAAPGMSRSGSAEGSRAELLTSTALDIKQKVMLSPEQQAVLKMVVEKNESVFFTGSAGTPGR